MPLFRSSSAHPTATIASCNLLSCHSRPSSTHSALASLVTPYHSTSTYSAFARREVEVGGDDDDII